MSGVYLGAKVYIPTGKYEHQVLSFSQPLALYGAFQ